jgi:hypothetical protein
VLTLKGAALDIAAKAYAKVGMAVADAFISCWAVKYVENLLRPVTYVQKVIAPDWLPLLNTPPFPEAISPLGAVSRSRRGAHRTLRHRGIY